MRFIDPTLFRPLLTELGAIVAKQAWQDLPLFGQAVEIMDSILVVTNEKSKPLEIILACQCLMIGGLPDLEAKLEPSLFALVNPAMPQLTLLKMEAFAETMGSIVMAYSVDSDYSSLHSRLGSTSQFFYSKEDAEEFYDDREILAVEYTADDIRKLSCLPLYFRKEN